MRDGKPQQRGLLIACGECQILAVPVNEWYDRRPPGDNSGRFLSWSMYMLFWSGFLILLWSEKGENTIFCGQFWGAKKGEEKF